MRMNKISASQPAEKAGQAGAAEPVVCRSCGAVYANGDWTSARKLRAGRHPRWQPAIMVTCPACKKIEKGAVGGYVTISGIFATVHGDEIDRFVENEAERIAEDDPLSRIMRRIESTGHLQIETSTQHLARCLGTALAKAFDGEAHCDLTDGSKVAHVTWHRD